MRVITLILGLLLSASARSECVATAYLAGTPVLRYVVIGTRDLAPLWGRYAEAYPQSARVSDIAERNGDLVDQCLVQVALADRGESTEEAAHEELILERPCPDMKVGRRVRLMVYGYCVELFGRDPDFYTTLPYRHAEVTWKRRM